MHYRLDSPCNVTTSSREVGIYPIPRPHYKVTFGDFGKQTRTVDYVELVETGYSIPFTKKNFDKIISEVPLPLAAAIVISGGSSSSGGSNKVSLSVDNGNMSFTVQSIEDLRDGVFEELCHFGRIPTDSERARWLEAGGIKVDTARQQQMLHKNAEYMSGAQQRAPTVDEVRDMIKQQQQQEGQSS